MNLRLGSRSAGVQKIKIAPLIGLCDVLGEEGAVAALSLLRRWLPFISPPRQLRFIDIQVQPAAFDIEFDLVPIPHQRERASDKRFWRDMQNAGPV